MVIGATGVARVEVGMLRVQRSVETVDEHLCVLFERRPAGWPGLVSGQERLHGSALVEIHADGAGVGLGDAVRLGQGSGELRLQVLPQHHQLLAHAQPQIGGQVGRVLLEPVPLEEVLDLQQSPELCGPLLGEVQRKPDDGGALDAGPAQPVDAQQVVGGRVTFDVERVVEHESHVRPDLGRELEVRDVGAVADVGEHELGGAPGAAPHEVASADELAGILDPERLPQLVLDPDAAGAERVLLADCVEQRFDIQVVEVQREHGVLLALARSSPNSACSSCRRVTTMRAGSTVRERIEPRFSAAMPRASQPGERWQLRRERGEQQGLDEPVDRDEVARRLAAVALQQECTCAGVEAVRRRRPRVAAGR